MSSPMDEHSEPKKIPSIGALVWRSIGIVLILLTPWTFYRDLKEAYEKGAAMNTTGTFAGKLQDAVRAQLAVLQRVDSGALALTYFQTLQSNECNWLFQCHLIRVAEPPNPLSAPMLDSQSLEKAREMALAPTAASPAPKVTLPSFVKPHELPGGTQPGRSPSPNLVTPLLNGSRPSTSVPGVSEADRENIAQIEQNLNTGASLSLPGKSTSGAASSSANANPAAIPAPPVPPLASPSSRVSSAAPDITIVATAPRLFTKLGLPTLHTIRATPRALKKMMIAIHDAGIWAMAMYLSCTLIWIMLWLRKMPLMLYLLILGGPFSVPLMVTVMQWTCGGLLKLGIAGCAIAAGFMALVPSTLLALAVGFRHAARSPRELFEAVEHLKR